MSKPLHWDQTGKADEFMREDNDEFGNYFPVLRRIIILVAVITAVPVMLWTVTAFVRAYVSPAKIPTFHQLASSASINAPISAEAPSTASERSSGTMPAKPAAPPPVIMAAAVTPSTAAADTIAAPKSDRSPESGSSGATPAPIKIANAPSAAVPVAPNATYAPASPWPPAPVPTTTAATDTAAPAPILAAATVAPPPASEQDPAAMPTATPLSGPIPLPRHRPSMAADTAPAPQTGVSTRVASSGPIPVPRPRPDAAGPSAPAEESGGNPLGFIKNLFGGGQ